MLSSNTWTHIRSALSNHGMNGSAEVSSVGGGCINDCYRVTAGEKQVFCKVNSAKQYPHLFTKEKTGLQLLQQAGMRVPAVIDVFETGTDQVLLLEWIRPDERTGRFWKEFGRQLAQLHSHTHEQFGLHEDNYMGSVAQKNNRSDTWVDFFQHQRLEPLVQICFEKGLLDKTAAKKFDQLYSKLPEIFGEPSPALVHGDLWSGNFMCSTDEEPVLIDPACYYGHPAVDLGMSTLFGGFHPLFYEAYDYHTPLAHNYRDQWKAANLYLLLIHLLLFGRSYLSQIEQALKDFTGVKKL